MIDFNLNEGSAIINNDLDNILQQIDLLFDTFYGEVFGYEDFGTQYDKFLYQLKMSDSDLRQNILNDLYSLNLFGYQPDVNVYLLQGTEQDIALIDIVLKRQTDEFHHTYKITH